MGCTHGYSWFDHFVVDPFNIHKGNVHRSFYDPEMPARRGGDRTMNNLSAVAEPRMKCGV
jgi:hypothetical protein